MNAASVNRKGKSLIVPEDAKKAQNEPLDRAW